MARLPGATDQVQVSTEGGTPIGWRADGLRFYYRDDGGVWEVVVGPDGPDVASAQLVFPAEDSWRSVSIYPDGERLVVVRGGNLYSDLVVRQGALSN